MRNHRKSDTVIFTGELSGDGECFHFANVESESEKILRLDESRILYPWTALDAMGCEDGVRYRFIISAEEIE